MDDVRSLGESSQLIGGTALGVVLSISLKFILDVIKLRKETTKEARDAVLAEVIKEREELQTAQVALRQDLMGQILALRNEVLKLREINSDYRAENARLTTKLELQEKAFSAAVQENAQLCARVTELEKEVHILRGSK